MAASTPPLRRRQRRYDYSTLGVGVDASGGPVVDPTKNVEDLVEANKAAAAETRASDMRYLDAQLGAQEKLQTFAREAADRFQTFAREFESKFQTALREAETGRIDQIADVTKAFQDTIRDMLAESVRSTSTLVSNQLLQIQATFNERVSKLEAFQWQSAGRSSVSDPQITETLAILTRSLAQVKATQDEALAKTNSSLSMLQVAESGVRGTAMGRTAASAANVALWAVIAAVATPVITLIVLLATHHL
jgi:hypothetical protein